MGKVATIGVAFVLLALVGCGGNASTTTGAPATTQAVSTTAAATQPPVTQAATTTTTMAATTTTAAAATTTTTTAATQSVTLKWGEKWSNEKIEITVAAPLEGTTAEGKKGEICNITIRNPSQAEIDYYGLMVFELFDTLGSSSKIQFPSSPQGPGSISIARAPSSIPSDAQPKSFVVSSPEILGDTQLIWQ